jgi:sRNA-binding regulator protein Hfq
MSNHIKQSPTISKVKTTSGISGPLTDITLEEWIGKELNVVTNCSNLKGMLLSVDKYTICMTCDSIDPYSTTSGPKTVLVFKHAISFIYPS